MFARQQSTFDLGALSAVFAALYLVWMLNLYNFMDGIDGIAGVEALIEHGMSLPLRDIEYHTYADYCSREFGPKQG